MKSGAETVGELTFEKKKRTTFGEFLVFKVL